MATKSTKRKVVQAIKPFTDNQKHYIANGLKLSQQLMLKASESLGIVKLAYEPKRHCYITSPPGAGKTFTVANLAKKHNINMIKVQGVSSVSNITARIAVAVYTGGKKKNTMWFDDCDSIFMDGDSLNIMKGALDSDRNVWSYQKNMTTQIQNYENSGDPNLELIAESLKAFRVPGSVGVEIPTDNLRFIVTSNLPLMSQTEFNQLKRKTPRLQHEAAVRSRFHYMEFKLDDNESWGWLASVVINNPILDLDDAQKQILLDWMYVNWARIGDPSMRTVLELAGQMLNYPNDYPNYWEMALI